MLSLLVCDSHSHDSEAIPYLEADLWDAFLLIYFYWLCFKQLSLGVGRFEHCALHTTSEDELDSANLVGVIRLLVSDFLQFDLSVTRPVGEVLRLRPHALTIILLPAHFNRTFYELGCPLDQESLQYVAMAVAVLSRQRGNLLEQSASLVRESHERKRDCYRRKRTKVREWQLSFWVQRKFVLFGQFCFLFLRYIWSLRFMNWLLEPLIQKCCWNVDFHLSNWRLFGFLGHVDLDT